MKKLIVSLVAALSLLFGGIAIGDSLNGNFEGNAIVKVKSNGNELKVEDVPAVNYKGRTVVPIYMLKQLGLNVSWDDAAYSVNIEKPKSDLQAPLAYLENYGSYDVTFQATGSQFKVKANYVVLNKNTYMATAKDLMYNMALTGSSWVDLNLTNEDGSRFGMLSANSQDILDYYDGKMSEKEFLTNHVAYNYFNQDSQPSKQGDNGQKKKLTAKEIAKLTDRVGMIVTYDQYGKPISQGSGFVIDHWGLIITNNHVMQFASSWDFKINGSTYHHNWYRFQNSSTDLFGLYANADPKTGKVAADSNFSFLPYTTKLPEVGDKVFAIGSPDSLTNTVSEGIVSGVRQINGQTMIQHSAFTDHGSSGGVLLNEYGEAIGVTSSGLEKTQANFAIPMIYVQNEIDKL